MDNRLTNNMHPAEQTGPTEAIDALDRLLAQAHSAHKAGEITVVEESLKVKGSYCRIAVIISEYGTHIEISSRHVSDNHITWTFREKDLAQARAQLVESFK